MQDLLTPYIARDYGIQIKQGVAPEKTMKPLVLPGPCVPVNQLPDSHAARYYLESVRGFDIEELATVWGVSWCERSHYMNAHQRIVFPVLSYGPEGDLGMYGYQCRYLNLRTGSDKPPDKMTPKYWTGPGTKKARLLYNAYRACYQPVVVLTEGPLDVIRVGERYGVCAFGKTVSPAQLELLWALWGQYGAVVIVGLDPDASAEQTATLVSLESTWPKGHVVPLRFGPGTDPGALERRLLHRMIVHAAWSAGWDLRAYFPDT